MKNAGIAARARYSLAGLRDAWQRERSFRAHQAFSFGLVLAMAWLQPGPLWWAVMVLAIAVGLALEAMNGAIEALCDLVEPRRHPQVRIVKDMASAASFLVNCAIALTAVVMGAAHWP